MELFLDLVYFIILHRKSRQPEAQMVSFFILFIPTQLRLVLKQFASNHHMVGSSHRVCEVA